MYTAEKIMKIRIAIKCPINGQRVMANSMVHECNIPLLKPTLHQLKKENGACQAISQGLEWFKMKTHMTGPEMVTLTWWKAVLHGADLIFSWKYCSKPLHWKLGKEQAGECYQLIPNYRHSEYASLPYGGSTKAWTCQDWGPTAAPGLSHIPPTDEIPAKIQAELCWVSEQALWEALSQALCF